ncbi:MAG TPA: hypothetical protein VGB42_06045 [Candidatus Thermoplasmatota archaeon]
MKAALASVPNFVRVAGGPVDPGYDIEVRMLADSRDAVRAGRGARPVAATLYFDAAWTRMRVEAGTRGERETARARLEDLLGGAVRLEGEGVD